MAKRKKARKSSRRSHGKRRRAAQNPSRPRSAHARSHKGRRPRRRRKNDGGVLKSLAVVGLAGAGTLLAIDVLEGYQIIPPTVTTDPIKHGLALGVLGGIGGYALYRKSTEAAYGVAGAAIGFGGFALGQGIKQKMDAKAAPAQQPPQAPPQAPIEKMRDMGAIEHRRRMRGLGAIENVYRLAAMRSLGRIQYADRAAA